MQKTRTAKSLRHVVRMSTYLSPVVMTRPSWGENWERRGRKEAMKPGGAEWFCSEREG